MREDLPVHFFTIVLNGRPFIEYHLEVFRRLPFRWHWHIVEGVAALAHDTGWSLGYGAKIAPWMHKVGLSTDGTREYLDRIKAEHPDSISIYRTDGGRFWDGKREMVNAPLKNIAEPCLLWEVDADELWRGEQIVEAHRLFDEQPGRTAAFYWCDYFLSLRTVISTRYNYGNNPASEWLRTWRYQPGDVWERHEPPVLVRTMAGGKMDIAKLNPFTQDEMEKAGARFQHMAYATEAQLRFKESYYGYARATEHWQRLNEEVKSSRFLRDYFPWVVDRTMVDTAEHAGIVPLAQRNANGTWRFPDAPEYANACAAARKKRPSPQIVLDCALEGVTQGETGNLWPALFREWNLSEFIENIVFLDRGGISPRIPGLRFRSVPSASKDDALEADIVESICAEMGADLFLTARGALANTTPTVFLHGLLEKASLPVRQNSCEPLANIFVRQNGIPPAEPTGISPGRVFHVAAGELGAIERHLREIARKSA